MADLKVKQTRVVATKRGFYKKLREPGEKFTYPLPEGLDMPTWMEEAGATAELELPEEPEGSEGSED
jgi:hypothetical protein